VASNREKLVNLIVANSNLEPSEATELIEEYTNNVADNEVENLINAMTEALGTKVGNKLDANGIKEVFDIAREHSNIKTDQEVAEEQARKQAIDEKQARRTEKAYEVIDQRRAEKDEARKGKENPIIEQLRGEFENNQKLLNDFNSKIKISDEFRKEIKAYIDNKYKNVNEASKSSINKLLIQKEECNQIEEQALKNGMSKKEAKRLAMQKKVDQSYEDVVPSERQTLRDKMIKVKVWMKNIFEKEGKKPEEENSVHPDIQLFDEAIKIKRDIIAEWEKELDKNPNDSQLIKNISNMTRIVEELENNKQEISTSILQEKAGYVDKEGTIPNTYKRLLGYQKNYEENCKIIEEYKRIISKNPNSPEAQQCKKDLLNKIHSANLMLRNINFEKTKGEEADFELNEEIEDTENDDKPSRYNYFKKITEYKEMIINSEISSATIQIEEYRKLADYPYNTKDLRLEYLEKMYKIEKNRIIGGTEIYGGNRVEGMAAIMEKGGLTADEVFEVEMFKIRNSKDSHKDKDARRTQCQHQKIQQDAFKRSLEKLSERGVSHQEISNFLLAIQRMRDLGDLETYYKCAGEDEVETLKLMMKTELHETVSTGICDKIYEEFGKQSPNGSIFDVIGNKGMMASKVLAEERLKYDRDLSRTSETEVVEPSKKVDKTTIRNIAAGVTKGEMDSITGTLVKDKNKPEITGQEQSETQTEIET